MARFARDIDLTKGNLFRNLVLFTIPFLLGNLMNSLYSAIDLFFIGQFSTAANMAAVSSGTTIMFAINAIILGLAEGGTIVIGNLIGARDENVGRTTKAFFSYMGLIALATTIILAALFYPIITWMKLTGETADIARTYLIILVAGIPFYTTYHSIGALLKANGNSTADFLFLAITIIVNVALDALFIIKFNMGTVGAALATTIGEAVGALFSILYLKRIKLSYETPKGLIFDKMSFKRFAFSGVPIAIQDGLVILSFAVILAFISVRGDNFTSAVGITDRVTSFGFAVLSAIGCSISTAAAQNAGAGNIKNIKKYMKYGIVISVIIGSIMTLVNIFCAKGLAGLFAGDKLDARDIATFYIMSTSLDLFVCTFVFSLNNTFLGTGHSLFSMTQNLLTTFVFRLPLAIIFCKLDMPMFVVGFAYPLSTIFSLIMCLIYYFSKKWMRNIYSDK